MRILIALSVTLAFALTLASSAWAEQSRPLLVPKLDRSKAVQQHPSDDQPADTPGLAFEPVWLAKNNEALRCSSTQTTCGDRPAWPMEVSMEVINKGTAPSPKVKGVIRITPGREYPVEVPPLYPGSSFTLRVEHNFSRIGHTEVRVELDPEHRTPDIFKYDSFSNILQMEIRPAKPDLVISSTSADNRYVLQTAKFSFTISNTGTVATGYPFKLKAEFVDSRAGTKMFDVPELRPGQSHTVTASHKYRAKGKKKINLLVDPESKIDEVNEKNNAKLMEFRIVYP